MDGMKKEDDLNVSSVEEVATSGDNPVGKTPSTDDYPQEDCAYVDQNGEIPVENVDNMVNNGDNIVETTPKTDDFVEETVDNVDNCSIDTEKTEQPFKSNKNKFILLGIVVIAAIVVALLGGGSGGNAGAFAYTKDNNLYLYSAKNDPVLVHEGISDGGTFSYYYSAWGASVSEDGKNLFYMGEIDANNMGNLYRKDAAKASATSELIASNVLDYTMSKDGTACAYLTYENDKVAFHIYKNGTSTTIHNDVYPEQDAYTINADGTQAIYKVSEGTLVSLYHTKAGSDTATLLAESISSYFVGENSVYYIASVNDVMTLFEYAYQGEATEIATGVYYAALMPNGEDVLYCSVSGDSLRYSDLVEDDVTDISQFDEDRQDAILSMQAKLGDVASDPILQYAYLKTKSGTVQLDREVVSIAYLEGDEKNYSVGYSMGEWNKMKLSEVESLDSALISFYTNLAYGDTQVFLGDATGKTYILGTSSVQPSSVMVAGDGKTVAYLETNASDTYDLKMTTLDDTTNVVTVAENVQDFAFLGDSATIVYYYDYASGLGKLGIHQNGGSEVISENATGMNLAVNKGTIYFVDEPDLATGNGNLVALTAKGTEVLDTTVFSFLEKENGNVIYVKNYDYVTQVGDLGYYNGKQVAILDTAITAIYVY